MGGQVARTLLWLVRVALGPALLRPRPAAAAPRDAAGAPTLTAAERTCDEAGLDAALAAGGAHTFACPGPTTIVVTSTKQVVKDTSLDGGGQLTISGADTRRVFTVSAAVTLGLSNLTISNGRVVGTSGSGGGPGGNGYGGGVYVDGGTLTVPVSLGG